MVTSNLAPWLQRWVPDLQLAAAERIVGALLGLSADEVEREREGATVSALLREIRHMSGASGLPVYPPIPAGYRAEDLRVICHQIAACNLQGAMFAGLETFTPEHRAAVRAELFRAST